MKRFLSLSLPLCLLAAATSSHAVDIPAGRYKIQPLLSNKCVDVTGTTSQLVQKDCTDNNTSQQFDISATSGGYYKVVSVANARVWDVSGSSTADGAQVIHNPYNGGNNEQFLFTRNGVGYVLKARHSGKCVEMKDWSGDVGGLVQQMACAGGSNQTFVLVPTGTDFGSVPDGRYKVTVKHSSKCLDVPNSNLGDSITLQQYTCNGTAAQQWDIYYVGGSRYEVRNVNSGKCVDAAGGWSTNGTDVQQYTCNHSTAQRWLINGAADNDGSVLFKSALDSSKVWDVAFASTSNGAGIQLWSNSNVSQQKWFLEPVNYTANVPEGTYSFVNLNSSKCLDVPNSSLSNGTQLQQYTCNSTAAQKFQVIHMGEGYYKIINYNSGLALHVSDYSTSDSAAMQQYEQHSGDNQLFTFVPYNTGYLVKPKSSYKCLDIAGASLLNNAQLIQYACNQNNNQVFKLQ